MNMIQLKNRPFAGKAPTTTQQAAVSYTHLDVYKRQVYNIGRNFSEVLVKISGIQIFFLIHFTLHVRRCV